MAPQKFKPPRCPGCKKPLFAVYENEYWTYDFNEETGTYKAYLADMEIRCPDCHYHITREPFPGGACNYQAKASDNAK